MNCEAKYTVAEMLLAFFFFMFIPVVFVVGLVAELFMEDK